MFLCFLIYDAVVNKQHHVRFFETPPREDGLLSVRALSASLALIWKGLTAHVTTNIMTLFICFIFVVFFGTRFIYI